MNQLGGYMRITSTRPILAFQLLGARNASTYLASVPAQGTNLLPQSSGRLVSVTRGANVISEDTSASLLVPPNALTVDTHISLTRLATPDLPSPGQDLKAVSRVEGLPRGTRFEIPVRLTFGLDVDVIPGTRLPLLIFEPSTSRYQATDFVAIVDGSGRTASAEVTHFTQYVAYVSATSLIQLSSISPSTMAIGDTVTLTGTGFSTTPSTNVVSFRGLSNMTNVAAVLSATATSIKVRVPGGAVSGLVTVRVGTNSSNGVWATVVAPNPAPGTIYLNPSAIISPTSPFSLSISGTSFVPTSVVKYDGSPLPTTFVDSTLLRVALSGTQLSAAIHHVSVFNPAPGGGTSNTRDFTVTVVNQAPIVDSGPAQISISTPTISLNGTVTDDGLPANSTITTTWTKVSGPGTATFTNSASRSTTATLSVIGTYVLRLTASDGALTSSDDIIVVFGSANQPPAVSAGPDLNVTLPSGVTLSGTATDDGLPSGSAMTVTWSKVSGPGTVTFGNANASSTTAIFSVAGTYVLRLTATDSDLAATDSATVVVQGINTAPTVNAGADQVIILSATALLNGTASDDGLPSGSTLATTWSKVSGPGTVSFGNALSRSTTAVFSTAGTYVLRLTATDGALTTTDSMTVVVSLVVATNLAPVVNAGPDQTIAVSTAATLSGTATDDGLPLGSILTTAWSKVSGPGTVTFGNAASRSTTAMFSAAGSYVLQLLGSDTLLSAADTLTVVVGQSSSASFYVDPTYTGAVRNGQAATPWKSLGDIINNTPWTVVNAALATQDVTIYFSARNATTNTDDYSGAIIDVNRRVSSTHVLTFNGRSLYNTSDTAPAAWAANTGSSRSRVDSFDSQNTNHLKRSNVTIDGFRIVKMTGGKGVSICGDNWTVVNSDISHSGATQGPLVLLVPTSDSVRGGSGTYCPPMSKITISNNIIHDSIGELVYLGGGGCVKTDALAFDDGSGATFNITRSGGAYSSVSVNTPGTGYTANQKLFIAGTSLGGTSSANDLTLTITAVGSGGSVLAVTVAGTAATGSQSHAAVASINNCQGFPAHDSITVSNNTLYNGGILGNQGDAIDLKGGLTNVAITGNNIYGLVTAGTRGIVSQGQQSGGPNQNILIADNFIHDFAAQGDAALSLSNTWGTPKGVTIRNNVINSITAAGCIRVYAGTALAIFNNGLFNCSGNALSIASGTVAITNNALFGNGASNTLTGTITASNNAFSNTSWGGTCTNCVSGLASTDFVNAAGGNFFPSSGSKLIDAGALISSFTTDILGTVRTVGQGWDIGPYEFQ
jgi:hypothetical protein